MTPRRCLSGILAMSLLSAGGCHSNNPPAVSSAPTPTTLPAVPSVGIDSSARRHQTPEQPAPEEVRGTAEVLAQQASTYAKSIAPLVDKRTASGAAGAGADVADAATRPADAGTDRTALAPVANASTAVNAQSGAAVQPPADASHSRAQVAAAITPAADAVVAPSATPSSDDLSRRLAQHVKDYPQDVATQLDYQLLQLVKGESVPQLPAMSGMAAEDREVVAAMLDGLSNFRDAVRSDNNLLMSRKIRPMLDLADRLRNQAELTIPTIALCTRVDGFGVYQPIEAERFIAGKEHAVIVYCEVENFSSQTNDKKLWETRLKQEIVLYTEQNGLEVWRDKTTKPIVDISRNRRHDFFVVKMIRLPANLTIGRYLLKVSIEDQQVSRIAENTVPIQIVAE